ncbi:MAG: 50S ribosomal protein L28 [Chloroflexi bacterium]|nr:50S ribosomal protein L28 [Chloroflexota bacterium]
MKCSLCEKSPQSGNAVSHSNRHTKRRWMPNVHPAIIMVNGKPKRVHLCTRCLRTQQKPSKKVIASLSQA